MSNSLIITKIDIIKERKIIYNNLSKYNKSLEKIYQNKIKNLMFHKKSHFTAIFTEYLIWDDNQEFLFELYSQRFSLINLSSFITIQCHKFFIPVLKNDWGRNLIKTNTKMKKIIISQISDKYRQNDPTKLKKYSKILPSDLSDNTLDEKEDMIDNSLKTYRNLNLRNINNNINNQTYNNNFYNNRNNKNNQNKNLPIKGKEYSESESTIDNVNANNDISISLDLKMNKKYDDNILTQNIGFVSGKNGKNDEELLKMMKFLKPINTAFIYENNNINNYNNNEHNNNNHKKMLKSNYIYLDYVNNKTNKIAEGTKKTSKNKSDNKKIIVNSNNNNNNNANINNEQLKTIVNLNNTNKYPGGVQPNIITQKNKSKNTSKNNKHCNNNEQKCNNNEQKCNNNNYINTKKNYKIYSKSNNKTNTSKNNNINCGIVNNNNNINNNVINGYNDLNNKTTSTKTNSNNTTYKNKSENRKNVLKNNRNKKNETNPITQQHNSDQKAISPSSNNEKKEQKATSNEKIEKEKEINMRYCSLKFGKTGKTMNSVENSGIQTIMISQKIISNSKDKNNDILKTNNNVNNINIFNSELKSIKRNNNKILDISSDAKKMKFLISCKEDINININAGKIISKKIVKKEKSLENKPLNNNNIIINKPIIGQLSNKRNIIIVKRKVSDGINTFH